MARNLIRLQQGLLTAEHRTRVRTACRTPMERAMIEILWTTRRAEAAALRWEHANLTTGLLLVPKGKGGTADWTLLLEPTREALAAWQAETATPTGWVFPVPGSGTPGRPYTPGGFAKVIQGILTRAGCWRSGMGNCHRLRRSFATAYITEHPGAITELQKLMRHQSISTTSLYIHYQPDDLAPRLARVAL